MSQVLFPVLSESDPDAEGVVSTWFAEDGSTVTAGELIGEVAMDKVDAEVNAPVAGVIRLRADEGDVVAQGSLIAEIEEA